METAMILRWGAWITLVINVAIPNIPALSIPSGNTDAMTMVSNTRDMVKMSTPAYTKEQSVNIFFKKRLVTLLTLKVKLIFLVMIK